MTRDDLLYSKEHEWLSTDGTGTATVGITDYATQELG
ncbi:MAG: glycine cleavage system protein H, partial [Acidipropionibacterium jensenii]|nr:glycine cleavage system protein H [Acidipropionibacterium jensenii]